MRVELKPGKYIVAVSGGVDSVVLLDLLAKLPDLELVVAHFDHGIRPDSRGDAQLVATLSQKLGLEFELGQGELGPEASEEVARQARYEFLRQCRKKHDATGVVTAHHQDDAVETLAFNVLRGTRRKGMSSLGSKDGVIRPLLKFSKQQIRDYAVANGLVWREDSTNLDEKYTRNWLRLKLLPRLSDDQKQELIAAYGEAGDRNSLLDQAVEEVLHEVSINGALDRKKFIALPYSVSKEVMVRWLRDNQAGEIDRKLIDNLVVGAKTLPAGKRLSIGRGSLLITADRLALEL